MMDWTKPLPGVPQVRVLDERGKEVLRGWYVYHETRQPCVFDDELKDDEIVHYVVHDSFADWNMPRELVVSKITPPHRIEVVR